MAVLRKALQEFGDPAAQKTTGAASGERPAQLAQQAAETTWRRTRGSTYPGAAKDSANLSLF